MADKRKGWILLYRSVRDSWIWDKRPFSIGQAWIDLILDANHNTNKFYLNGRLQTVKRGQTWTSIRTLASRWGWRKDSVSDFLKALEKDKMITLRKTSSGTLLTIVNYGKFQDRPDTSGDANRDDRRDDRRDETKNDKRTTKEGKKEVDLPSEENTDWFESLEDDNDTTEH